MMYRRTALPSGLSPSELLNGRQIRSKIDIIKPSPSADAQRLQARESGNELKRRNYRKVRKITHRYLIGTACYAKVHWPRKERDPRWVPATVVEALGSRRVRVKIYPTGPNLIRHIEQLQPRFGTEEDDDPGEDFNSETPILADKQSRSTAARRMPLRRRSQRSRTPRMPIRRSDRPPKPRQSCDCEN